MDFFTSDLHFNSLRTIKSDGRPFKNEKQMDKYIIRQFNKQAGKNDTIYVIGDFLNCSNENDISWQKSIFYAKKIKAEIVLILGNNEERIIKYYFGGSFNKFRDYCLFIGFKDVLKNHTIKIVGEEFFLTHKPKDCKLDKLNLFGHMHAAGGIYKSFGFSVCCDLSFFRLLTSSDIQRYLKKKNKYWAIDENLKLI